MQKQDGRVYISGLEKLLQFSLARLDQNSHFWWNYFQLIIRGSSLTHLKDKKRCDVLQTICSQSHSELGRLIRITVRDTYSQKDYDRLLKASERYFQLTDRALEKNPSIALRIFDHHIRDLLFDDLPEDTEITKYFDHLVFELLYFIILQANGMRVTCGRFVRLFCDPPKQDSLQLYRKNLEACFRGDSKNYHIYIQWLSFLIREGEYVQALSTLSNKLSITFDEQTALKVVILANAVLRANKELSYRLYQNVLNIQCIGYLISYRIWARPEDIKFRPKLLKEALLESFDNFGRIDEIQKQGLRSIVEPDTSMSLLTEGLSDIEHRLLLVRVFVKCENHSLALTVAINCIANAFRKKEYHSLAHDAMQTVSKMCLDELIPALYTEFTTRFNYLSYQKATRQEFILIDPLQVPDDTDVFQHAQRNVTSYFAQLKGFLVEQFEDSTYRALLSKEGLGSELNSLAARVLLCDLKVQHKLLERVGPSDIREVDNDPNRLRFSRDLLDFLDQYIPFVDLLDCKELIASLSSSAVEQLTNILKGSAATFIDLTLKEQKKNKPVSKSTTRACVQSFKNYWAILNGEIEIPTSIALTKKIIISSTLHFVVDMISMQKTFQPLTTTANQALARMLDRYVKSLEQLAKDAQKAPSKSHHKKHHEQDPDTLTGLEVLHWFIFELSRYFTDLSQPELKAKYLDKLYDLNLVDEIFDITRNAVVTEQESKKAPSTNQYRHDSADHTMKYFEYVVNKRFDLPDIALFCHHELEQVYLPRLPAVKLSKFVMLNDLNTEALSDSIVFENTFFNSAQYYTLRFFLTLGQIFIGFENMAIAFQSRQAFSRLLKISVPSNIDFEQLATELGAKVGFFYDIVANIKGEVQDAQFESTTVCKTSLISFIQMYSQVLIIAHHITKLVKLGRDVVLEQNRHKPPATFAEYRDRLIADTLYLQTLVKKAYPNNDTDSSNKPTQKNKSDYYYQCWTFVWMLCNSTCQIIQASFFFDTDVVKRNKQLTNDSAFYGWNAVKQGVVAIQANLSDLVDIVISKKTAVYQEEENLKQNDERRILIGTMAVSMNEEAKDLRKKVRQPGKLLTEDQFLRDINVKYRHEYQMRDKITTTKEKKLDIVKAKLFNEKGETETNWNTSKLEQVNCFATIVLEMYVLFMRLWMQIIPPSFAEFENNLQYLTSADVLSGNKHLIDSHIEAEKPIYSDTKLFMFKFLNENYKKIELLKTMLEGEQTKFGSSKKLASNFNEMQGKVKHYTKHPYDSIFESMYARYTEGNQKNIKWLIDYITKRLLPLSYINFDSSFSKL